MFNILLLKIGTKNINYSKFNIDLEKYDNIDKFYNVLIKTKKIDMVDNVLILNNGKILDSNNNFNEIETTILIFNFLKCKKKLNLLNNNPLITNNPMFNTPNLLNFNNILNNLQGNLQSNLVNNLNSNYNFVNDDNIDASNVPLPLEENTANPLNNLNEINNLFNNNLNSLLNLPNLLPNNTSQTSIDGLNYNELEEKYENELKTILDMGFIDKFKILRSLYVCCGKVQEAVNYYLTY